MSMIGALFGKRPPETMSPEQFWAWFKAHEVELRQAANSGSLVERKLVKPIAEKLHRVHPGVQFEVGAAKEGEAELILTAEGIVSIIDFVEAMVEAAPKLDHWKVTALKHASNDADMTIEIGGKKFDRSNLFFSPNIHEDLPDLVDLNVVHTATSGEPDEVTRSGVLIFIDNLLGEVDSISHIDHLEVVPNGTIQGERIPIAKLPEYLNWRRSEFVEKYDRVRYDTRNDTYTGLEGRTPDGQPIIAIINAALLKWDRKASHPWLATITFTYRDVNGSGMPDAEAMDRMNAFEDELGERLKDMDGYLNVGRRTGGGCREIYFACREFRAPSKALRELKGKFEGGPDLEYELHHDKYWRALEHFTHV